MAEISYRPAALDDAAAIHALLLRLAPEIPLLIDTLEREEALYAQIRNCARSGESWVASDAAGRIVGFVLVEMNQLGRHYAENEVLDLRYAGVTPEHRRGGIFTRLVGKLTERMVPITVRVGAQNRGDVAALLEQLGFSRVELPGEHRFRWQPGTDT